MLGVHKRMHSDKIKLRSFLTTLYFAGDARRWVLRMETSKEKYKKYLDYYLEYASTDKARAVLFAKKYLNKSSGHWIDIIDCESYQSESPKILEFKLVICGLYKRKLKPNYPPKKEFIHNGKFDKKEYYLAVRAITWETANRDISQQKSKGVKGEFFEIRGVKYNKNKGKFIKRPPWLDNPIWKDLNIYSLRGADRAYVQQFFAAPDWRYEIKSVRKLAGAQDAYDRAQLHRDRLNPDRYGWDRCWE